MVCTDHIEVILKVMLYIPQLPHAYATSEVTNNNFKNYIKKSKSENRRVIKRMYYYSFAIGYF
jgi:hypothetical protein